jgi:hypothetical protein
VSTSRRTFLRNSAIAGATVALNKISTLADPAVMASAETSPKSASTTTSPTATHDEFTRGIGVYPGDPRDNFSPEIVIDRTTYRNLALLRPAYHSSSYNYNLTAQLITDGIKDTRMPSWVATSTSGEGILEKQERELILDHSRTSSIELFGGLPSLQIQLGGESVPEVDRVDIVVTVARYINPADLSFKVSVSEDGRNWSTAGTASNPPLISTEGLPPDYLRMGPPLLPSIAFASPVRGRFYRIDFAYAAANAPDAESQSRFGYVSWRVSEVEFYRRGQRVQVGGPYDFTSAWMSEGLGEEWVYVDLGAHCEFDRVKLYWIARAAEGSIQVSDDAEHWRDLHKFADANALTDDYKLAQSAHGRYVRVLMKRPTSPDGYVLSEIEVYGRGGPVAKPRRLPPTHNEAAFKENTRFDLAGSAWRVQRASLTQGGGEDFSKLGFADKDWIIATVPGTVLTSYLNVEAIPDPGYGANQLYISDSFFYSDFWYRSEFTAPAIAAGNMAWLNFDGINWKAEIFLNGEKLGRIDGAFATSQFDVTKQLRSGKNALAVHIIKNDTPGSCKQKTWESGGPNGGALGADNPTYHASVGWDWIPTIRGRNTGINGDVYLTTTGAVTIENPFISSALPLPNTSRADVSIEAEVLNHSANSVTGTLRGSFGDIKFEQQVPLSAGEKKHVKFSPSTHPGLRMQNPKLWWPVGYGDPNLYDVKLEFVLDGGNVSDTNSFKSGIREMAYAEDNGVLRIWINGRRFIPRGGNWGFSEAMLRFRKREYDAALRYHREMYFNMVRNWVGQVHDEDFYAACDEYGVLVWQDFWLANPWDGPNPDDDNLFLNNAQDTVLRIRNHPSIGLYCGRNEGYPPKVIEDGIRATLAELHPGLHYIPSSADGVVNGGGPYSVMPLTWYTTNAAFTKLHSEIGMRNIPSFETVKAYLSPAGLWPPGLEWGLHDCAEGRSEERGPTFFDRVEQAYSKADNLEEWIWLAHFLDCDGFRAEFEAQSTNRLGLLLWMSHPCWQSLLWQTYDYLFDPTPAYFTCKNVCEPLHIQWNRITDLVQVVNYSAGDLRKLTAQAEVLNMDGSLKWKRSILMDSMEDSTETCFSMEYPAGLTPVHFVRLTLLRGGEAVSRNLYLRPMQEGNYRAIRQLPKARIKTNTVVARHGDVWQLTTHVQNLSAHPSLMTRLKVVRTKSGDRILPVIYEDNYFNLMPGEERTIKTELKHADTRGERPRMVVEGFNVETAVLR